MRLTEDYGYNETERWNFVLEIENILVELEEYQGSR